MGVAEGAGTELARVEVGSKSEGGEVPRLDDDGVCVCRSTGSSSESSKGAIDKLDGTNGTELKLEDEFAAGFTGRGLGTCRFGFWTASTTVVVFLLD